MIEKIGEGAFGIVMKAIDLNDNQECAVKVIVLNYNKLIVLWL